MFCLGGLLQIEARNYIETKKKYDSSFKSVCPLVSDNKAVEEACKRGARTLSTEDMEYFESKDGFVLVMNQFIKELVESERNTVNNDLMEYYKDFSRLDFDTDIGYSDNPHERDYTTNAHVLLLFLFDLMQFSF